jgi:hypothetical protein
MRNYDPDEMCHEFKKYQPSRQPRAYMQKNLREGRWHILTSPLTRDCRIWHNCEQYGNTQDLVKHRHIHEARYGTGHYAPQKEVALAWRCGQCNLIAPEGIQGMYVMMDWDRATKEISEAMQDDSWNRVDDDVPF